MSNEKVSMNEGLIAASWRDAVLVRFQKEWRLGDVDARRTRAAAEAQAHFQNRVRGLRVDARTADDLIAALRKQMRLFTLLLAAVGGIALVVGGAGAMNVMLAALRRVRRGQSRPDALSGVPRRRPAGGFGRGRERLRRGGRTPQARRHALERRGRREPHPDSALPVAGRTMRRVLQGSLKTANHRRCLSEQICRTPGEAAKAAKNPATVV